MWTAVLMIKNKITNTNKNIVINIPYLYTYNILFGNINKLCDYKSNNVVTFSLCSYKDIPVIVEDWTRYILDKDKILIIIREKSVIKYSLFTGIGAKVMTVSKIEDIYKDVKMEHVIDPLFIYAINEKGHRKLIDVITNETKLYNDLITRLVHNYNW